MLATHEYAPFRGGTATYVHEVAAAAVRQGLPVEVWTVDYTGRHPAARTPGGVEDGRELFPVVRLRANGRLTPGGLRRLAWGFWRQRRWLRGRPVVLLSVGAQMAFVLLAAVGQRPGGPVTCFFHGSEVLRFQRNPLWRLLARAFYRQAHAFAANTEYVANLAKESGLLPPRAQVSVAPCGLPETFHMEQTALDQSRLDEAGVGDYRVLTVARLHPRKGQVEVARALGLLPEPLRQRVVYQVVGTGDEAYRQAVEVACRAGGVRCEFLGGLDDHALGHIYARATVYAQASRTLPQSVEGFGITFLEAAAYGCPAAAWRSGGVAEAVRDGGTGLLVEEGNVAGLSVAIARLLTEPELRARLGKQAQEVARTFRWEPAARTLWEVAAGSAAPLPPVEA